MSLGRTVTLNNGLKVPQVGFGTWQSAPGEVEKAVEAALKTGYRHIDCALIYGNQNEVASGIADAKVPREDITLVSKLWNNSHRPEHVEADLDLTLSQLSTTYLDVYLIHWPVPFQPGEKLSTVGEDGKVIIDTDAPGIVATWKKLIEIYEQGEKVKAIGVSNFTKSMLEKIIKETGVVPVMNQIECHPSLIQPELFAYCKEQGIIITAYSPLGNNITGKPRIIDSEEVKAIAKRLNKEPAQVLIAWVAHQGFCVIPKSVTPSRIASNFDDFKLEEEDFEAINKIGRANTVRTNVPSNYKPSWPINVFEEPEEQSLSLKVW